MSFARLDVYARREGISLRDAARRFQRKGARVQRERRRAEREERARALEAERPRVRYWWEEPDNEPENFEP